MSRRTISGSAPVGSPVHGRRAVRLGGVGVGTGLKQRDDDARGVQARRPHEGRAETAVGAVRVGARGEQREDAREVSLVDGIDERREAQQVRVVLPQPALKTLGDGRPRPALRPCSPVLGVDGQSKLAQQLSADDRIALEVRGRRRSERRHDLSEPRTEQDDVEHPVIGEDRPAIGTGPEQAGDEGPIVQAGISFDERLVEEQAGVGARVDEGPRLEVMVDHDPHVRQTVADLNGRLGHAGRRCERAGPVQRHRGDGPVECHGLGEHDVCTDHSVERRAERADPGPEVVVDQPSGHDRRAPQGHRVDTVHPALDDLAGGAEER
jgi:hypothetical protein